MAEDDKKPEGETPKKKTGPAPSQVNPKDVENQKRINKGAEENLALSERINKMLNRRISLQQDEVKLQRDISNVLQDQVKHSSLQANEKRKITDLTKALYDTSEKALTTNKDLLGTDIKSADIAKAIQKTEQQMMSLQFQKNKATGQTKELQAEINKNIDEQVALSTRALKEMQRMKEVAKDVENNKIAKGFGEAGDALKQIPGLSVFSGPMKEGQKAAQEAQKHASLFGKGMMDASSYSKKGLAELGKNAEVISAKGNKIYGAAAQKALQAGTAQLKGVNVAMLTAKKGLTGFASAAMKAFAPFFTLINAIKAGFQYDQQLTELQRGLGVSREMAHGLRQGFSEMAMANGEVAINSKDIGLAFSSLNEQFGTASGILRDDIVVETARLQKLTNMSAESTAAFAKYANISGKEMGTITKEARRAVVEAEAEGGARLNINKTLDKAGKIGGQISAQLGGNPAKLAKAVALANQFGMELEQVAAAGKSLLDFESSIEAELEAELLTGKQLNLERARAAALAGDYETLTREINEQVGSYADFTKMNVLQQDALAKSLGMSSDQLADQLLQKENLNQLAQEARAEGDEDLAKQLEARSAQEQFNDTVAQLQQMFVDLMGGPFGDFLMGLAEVVAFVGEIVMGFIGIFQWIGKLFAPIGKFIDKLGVAGKVMKGLGRIAVVVAAYKTYQAVAGALAATVVGGIAAPIVAGAAAAAVMAMGFAALSSASAKANDAVFPGGGGGYGKRALLSEGSVTLFNDKDTIVAGTKLNKADDMISKPEGTVQATNTDGLQSAIVGALNDSKPGTVVMSPFEASGPLYSSRKRGFNSKFD